MRFNIGHWEVRIRARLVVLIYQIHHHLRHHILLLRAALGDHQRQGDQCVVVQKARAVGTVEDAVVLQKPQEQKRRDAFVTVAEQVVLDCQVEQIGRFILDAWTAEGLVNRTHRAFERLVLLEGEQLAAAELVAQHLQRLHRILIGRMKRFLRRGCRNLQLLIVITIERVEAISVVRNHAQQPDRLGFRNILCSQNIGEQADGLFQLLQPLGFGLAVNRIAF